MASSRVGIAIVLSASALAAPLAAQEAACGGKGAGGQWIGGAQDASDIATSEAYAEQMALVLNGNAYVALFSVSMEAELRIEAAGRGNGDPTLTVLDAEGAEIATDDDSGGNGAARIETALQPGDYCAVVRSFDDAPMTAFVRVGRTEMEALTPGTGSALETTEPPTQEAPAQSCADGRDLGVLGETPLTYQATAVEAPYARFTLEQSTAISVTADNPDADPTIKFFDPDGALLGDNDDFDGLNSRIDLSTPLAAGTYCIGLDAISDPDLPIDVAVSLYDSEAALADLYARGEAAPPLDGSTAITDLGVLANRVRKDVQVGSDTIWFSAVLDAPGLLLIEAIASGQNGDPWLAIFDDLGRQIAQNDDDGQGTNAKIATRLSAGTYLIGLKQVGERSGFVRLAMERYIPAP